MTMLLFGLLGLAGAIGWASESQTAQAETKALSEPISITADQLVTNIATHSAEFSGNVIAVQGETQIKADRLTVHYQTEVGAPPDDGAGTIKRISAQGHVHITFDNRLAVSEQAVYITSERKLVLEGPGSKVTSGQNEIVGSKITYYQDDGRVTVEGDDQNRVKAVFHSDENVLNEP